VVRRCGNYRTIAKRPAGDAERMALRLPGFGHRHAVREGAHGTNGFERLRTADEPHSRSRPRVSAPTLIEQDNTDTDRK
jgi:hypothetical protein